MSPEQRQRYALLGLALLLHCVVFLALYHYIIFPAPPPEAAVSEFHQFAVPARTLPPPATPATAAALPNFTPATPAPQEVTIVTSAPSTFTMPKIDLPTPQMPNLPPPTTTAEASAPVAPSADPGTTGTANSGNGNGTGAAGGTDSYTAMDNALKGDTRPGEIVGICYPASQSVANAATIDDIVQRALTVIGWEVTDPTLDQGHPGLKHGKDVPLGAQHPELFLNYSNTFADITGASKIVRFDLKDVNIKTLVLISNFKNPNYDKLLANDYQKSRYPDRQLDEQEVWVQKFIAVLKARNIRLCIINFENPPFPSIESYVQESGGVVLYPKGIPSDKIATQLKNTAIAP